MGEISWIKIKINMFGDEKIQLIEATHQGDTILLIWIKLLTLAAKNNGSIFMTDGIAYTDEMVSIILKKPLLTVVLALKTLEEFEMIETDGNGIHIINWEKHQNVDGIEKVREQNRVRKFKERLKKKEQSRDSHVTVTQSHATDIELELDSDTKSKKKELKTLYSECVKLSDSEYSLLIEKYETEEKLKKGIETLNNYLQSSGKKYKSHYHVLIGWVLERVNESEKSKGLKLAGNLRKDTNDEIVEPKPRFKQKDYLSLSNLSG